MTEPIKPKPDLARMTGILVEIVKLLEPLSDDARRRVLESVAMFMEVRRG